MPGGLLGKLGDLFKRRYGPPQMPQTPPTIANQGASWPQATSGPAPSMPSIPSMGGGTQSSVPEFNDPIVAQLNQQLAQENPSIATEDEQLQQEQHDAWGNYDFERCIVIFGRLRELHPDDPAWAEKLTVSYFNRGKQYEEEGNEERAVACYYSALSIDSEFAEAKEAAEALLEKEQAEA